MRELELGCGDRKRRPDSIGIDIRPSPAVDIVGDVYEVLPGFESGSVDVVTSHHFLEHLGDLHGLLQECARILVVGGKFSATVPHFSSPYFYSDPTHATSFGLYTMDYLVCEPFRTRRQVPRYQDPLPFRIDEIRFGFKSPRPFYFRYALKRLFGAVANSTIWTKEFYEENLTWIVPAYEVEYRMTRVAR